MNNKRKGKGIIISGLLWKFAERTAAQGVSFVVSVILARLLLPSDYGIVALVLIFVNLANVFVSTGFSTALIQKKDADDTDYSTMLYCSLAVAVIMYIALFFFSPAIEGFFNQNGLCKVIRVLSLILIVNAFKSIQHAYVSSNMLFKRFFYSTLGGTVVSAVVGIVMAYMGFGVWALVAQNMINTTIDTIILYVTVKWRPHMLFSFKRAKSLMLYGWNITLGQLLSTGYNQIRSIVVGKIYTSADLAFYNKGEQIPQLITVNIDASVSSVLFPALANENDDIDRVKVLTRNAIRTSSYVLFPLMFGIAAVAEPFVRLLLTEKWMFCVPYMRLACISYAFIPLNSTNIQSIKALGRSDIFLKIEIVKKSLGILLIVMTMFHSVFAIACSNVFINVLAIFVNSFPNKKLMKYGVKEQLVDVSPYLIASIAMAVIVYMITYLHLGDLVTIILQLVVGVVVYCLISYFCKFEPYNMMIDVLKKIIFNK